MDTSAQVRRPWPRRAALAAVLPAIVATRWALHGLTDGTRGREARIAILGSLRVAYPLFVLALLAAGTALVLLGIGRRRRGVRRSGLIRSLALAISTGIAVLLAEVTAGAYLAWVHRMPSPPAARALKEVRDGGDVQIVVVGESSAEGVPYRDWLSVGKVVAWQLRRAIPWRMFHVEVQARPGWTLEQMHQRLVESRSRPDVVIVYAGHNEFASRFGWSSEAPHYRDETSPFAALSRRFGRLSPLVRLVAELHEKELVGAPPRPAHRLVVDVPSHTPGQRAERLADFRRRLEGIVAYCESVGAVPVLVIPPGNDAGYEPNRSVLPADTPRTTREAFARDVEAARRLERTDPEGSLRRYLDLIARQPGFAEAHFRLARLLEAKGDEEGAYRHYVAARDADGHPMRCPTDFQDVYREVADRHGAILVDGQAVFRARHPGGQLDDALFNDAMHPSFEGQVALAEEILAGLRERGAFDWPSGAAPPRIDLAECADHFDVNRAAWAAASEFAASFYRTTAPIRFDGSERLAKAARYAGASGRLGSARSSAVADVPGIGLRSEDDRVRR